MIAIEIAAELHVCQQSGVFCCLLVQLALRGGTRVGSEGPLRPGLRSRQLSGQAALPFIQIVYDVVVVVVSIVVQVVVL